MSSREDILARIQAHRPKDECPLPDVAGGKSVATIKHQNQFRMMLESAGAVVVETGPDATNPNAIDPDVIDTGAIDTEIERSIRTVYGRKDVIVSVGVSISNSKPIDDFIDERDFNGMDLFVCRGKLGVAENGAIWVSDSLCGRRAALFLAEHVTLVVDRQSIVQTMHEAYDRISVDQEGFGIFVAGPSKTADIEQSLVIGAHGPRSLLVILTG